MAEIEYSGQCQIGHNVKIGYFAQNQASPLNPEKRSFKPWIYEVAEGQKSNTDQDNSWLFLFSGDDIDKKVGVLSGGERTRLAMVKLLLEPVNLLILDEPTNHLDLKSKRSP